MRKTILIILFALLSIVSFSQNVAKSYQVSFRENGVWSNWYNSTNTLYIDLENRYEIKVINTKGTYTFDILEIIHVAQNDYDEILFEFACVDDDNIRCNIVFARPTASSFKQISIIYSNMTIAYRLD